ncbi:4'-phosphopantetheinyl transferase superfamily protein [Thioclava sp. BHET1]|nr:4'-phosphopantetheinyl transferase superfamily protein [Thioclava sp. BHET1]
MRLPARNATELHWLSEETLIMAGHGGGPRAIRSGMLLEEAQRHLGLRPVPAPHRKVDATGRPAGMRDWPAGQSGSFSHWGDYTLCLLHRGSRLHWGVDLEEIPDAQTTQEILSIALDQNERDLLSQTRCGIGAEGLARRAVSVFSAKESFYKAAYPKVGTFFGFDALRLAAPPTPTHLQFTVVRSLTTSLPAGKPVSIGCRATARAVISWCSL